MSESCLKGVFPFVISSGILVVWGAYTPLFRISDTLWSGILHFVGCISGFFCTGMASTFAAFVLFSVCNHFIPRFSRGSIYPLRILSARFQHRVIVISLAH